MTSDDGLVRRVALWSAVVGALTALYALVAGGPWAALSSAAGTLVGVINVAALARIITQIFYHRDDAARVRAAVFLVFKTGALVALVWLIVSRREILNGWFTIGFTASVIATTLGGLWGSPPSGGAPTDPDEGSH